MGAFHTPIALSSLDAEEWETMDALVDTGAAISSAPASILHSLGVATLFRQEFTLADGRTRDIELGHAWLRIGERQVITLVVFNEEGSEPILGALALEALFLGADPVNQRLIPVRAWLAEARLAPALRAADLGRKRPQRMRRAGSVPSASR